jgi:post-segregation antitoxin (ccd killing protein)
LNDGEAEGAAAQQVRAAHLALAAARHVEERARDCRLQVNSCNDITKLKEAHTHTHTKRWLEENNQSGSKLARTDSFSIEAVLPHRFNHLHFHY